jgi:transcriptional regulator with XRE-family HTH domain
MDIRKIVGANIRRLRIEAGIPQEELAARMGVDQGYVSKLEAGQRNPTITTIGNAAKALGIDADRLFTSHRD